MNEMVNKLLLAVDKSMPEIHLTQSKFIYSACRTFTKIKNHLKNKRLKTYLSKQIR